MQNISYKTKYNTMEYINVRLKADEEPV